MGKMETYVKITVCNGKDDEREQFLEGVSLGKLDTRLEVHYKFYTESLWDWEEYIKEVVREVYGFSLKTDKEVTAFLAYLESKGTTFKEWWEGYLKAELLKLGIDYDKRKQEKECR